MTEPRQERRAGRQCPVCGAWIQRALDGTPADGMRARALVVHPEEGVPDA